MKKLRKPECSPEEILKYVYMKGADFYGDGTTTEEINADIKKQVDQALTQLRAYYREKIKSVLPEKKKEYESAQITERYNSGYNEAIDAILKEIDKEME